MTEPGPATWSTHAARVPRPLVLWWRAALAVAAVAVAYAPTLRYDVRGLFYESPLASLGLVPVLAVAVGLTRLLPGEGESDVHDRQVDVIAALALILMAFVVLRIGRGVDDALGWQWRVDALARPLFAAGAGCLLLGVRMVWRARALFALLLLAWPPPWQWALAHALPAITGATRTALAVLPAMALHAQHLAGGDGSQFLVHHGTTAFVLSVASACGGASGLTGWVIVASALCVVLRGRRRSKLAWLVTGAAVQWMLNVARIALIFAAGHRYGEQVAMAGLHPWLGYLALGLGAGLMWCLLGAYGLDVPPRAPRESRVRSYARAVDAVPRVVPAAALLAVCVVAMSAGVARLADAAPLATVSGDARVAPFSLADLPTGWVASLPRAIDVGRPEFGASSSWTRWFVSPPPGSGSAATVWVDDVTTSDLGSLSTFTVAACYDFHSEAIGPAGALSLGAGTVAELLTHREAGMRWVSLDWVWPVTDAHGPHRYERLTLLEPAPAGTDGHTLLAQLAREITTRRLATAGAATP